MKRPHILHRLRHFRGHGIHSPFVYGLKREVFMGKCRNFENNPHYKALIANGVPKKVAKELQKLHNYCNFRGIEIVDSENSRIDTPDGVLYIATEKSRKAAMQMLGDRKKGAVAVVKDKEKNTGDGYVTIWRKRYTLYIKDEGLQPQVFKL